MTTLASRHLRIDSRRNTKSTFVSVVIPVRNESAFIADTLEQILAQDYDPDSFEIIVADGASTDGTRDIVESFQSRHSNLRLVWNAKRWSSAGRNAAIQASKGDVILIIDGHCELRSSTYVTDLVDAFERSGADCIGRPQPLDVSDASSVQQAIALARSSRLGHHPSSYVYSSAESYVRAHSCGVAYRREVFEKVGAFDERFDACEDVELNYRVDQAGLRCFFSPSLAVHYHPRATLVGLFRQMVRYGRGRGRLFLKHPRTFSMKSFLPAAFVLGIIIGGMLATMSSTCLAAYVATLSAYALMLGFGSLVIAAQNRRPLLLPLLPIVFLVIHVGAGVGALHELVLPRGPTDAAGTNYDRQFHTTPSRNENVAA